MINSEKARGFVSYTVAGGLGGFLGILLNYIVYI
jgi:hypothetical protein